MNKKNHRSFGYIRKLPSKLYQASYVGPDGKRHYAPRPFAAKSDADGFLALEQTAMNQGKWVRPSDRCEFPSESKEAPVTIRQIFPTYLALRTTKTGEPLRRSSKDLYTRQMFITMAEWLDVPIDSISRDSYSAWYMKMQALGKKTTASKCYSLMRSVLSWAVEQGHLKSNPVVIKGGYTSSSGRETEILTDVQIRALTNAIEPQLRLAILLSAYGGLRFSELAGLQRRDLQILPSAQGIPEELTISVSRGAVKVKKEDKEASKKYEIHVGPPKSRMSKRRVTVHNGLIPFVRSHMDEFVGQEASALVFGIGEGRAEHMNYDYFEYRYSKAKKLIGCESIDAPAHSLRKFGATQYANSGANLNELSEWLGDSSIEAIKRYVKTTGRAQDLANKMKFDEK